MLRNLRILPTTHAQGMYAATWDTQARGTTDHADKKEFIRTTDTLSANDVRSIQTNNN
jgi:hypothetical protein